MKTILRPNRPFLLLAILLMSMLAVAPTYAAPSTTKKSRQSQCVPAKHIQNWRSVDQLSRQGFNSVVDGDLASMGFDGDLLLNLDSNPANHEYQVSRATEIDTNLPIAQRVKCWQAMPGHDLVVEFRVRFDQSAPPPNLEEDMFLWNAPLAGPNNPEPPQLLTAIGVARTSGLGAPMYIAEVVQDLDLATFSGLFEITPVPAWLNAADWHNVRVTISQTHAQIEMAQGAHPFTLIQRTALLHPAEPLGFEFSLDTHASIPVADGLEASCLDIRTLPRQFTAFSARPSLCRR
jgi:hypothetical protein